MNWHLSRIIALAKYKYVPTIFNNRCLATSNLSYRPYTQRSQSGNTSTKQRNVDNELEEPVKYFGSKAATWQAKQTRSGGHNEDMLWYQPYVVTGSVAIFLIYFCILREENDIDIKLKGSLFDHVSGLEETQLFISYKYNKENGLDVTDLEKRMKELGIDINKM